MVALEVPEIVSNDSKSAEVLRAFILGDGRLVIVHPPKIFEDPAAWGILCADLARHVSNACVELGEDNPLERIVEVFNAEITDPTSPWEGRMVREQ
jgi:predicted SnoaL-like aldol condensation-catalyzing enzyme